MHSGVSFYSNDKGCAHHLSPYSLHHPTALLSPRVIQALNKLGRDPQAALRKHQGDPAMGAVLAALSGLLGDHFEALGKEQPEEQEQEQEPRGKIEDVTDRDPAALARERAEQAAADEVGLGRVSSLSQSTTETDKNFMSHYPRMYLHRS